MGSGRDPRIKDLLRQALIQSKIDRLRRRSCLVLYRKFQEYAAKIDRIPQHLP